MDRQQQDIIYTLGMYEQHIKQLSQQLQAVEKNIVDLNSLFFDLDEIKKGKEILAQVGNGIFVNANILSDELTVNVGGKNFVKKNISGTKKLIEEQVKKLKDVKQELEENFEKVSEELQEVMNEVEENRKE